MLSGAELLELSGKADYNKTKGSVTTKKKGRMAMATVFRGMAGTMFNATWSVTDDAIEVKGKGTFKFSDISSARNTPPSARWKNGVVMVTTKTGRSLVLPYKYDQTAEAGEAYRAIAAGAGMIKDAGSSDSRTSYVTPELAQQRQKTGGLSGGTIRVIIVAAILLLVGLWIFSGGKGGGNWWGRPGGTDQDGTDRNNRNKNNRNNDTDGTDTGTGQGPWT